MITCLEIRQIRGKSTLQGSLAVQDESTIGLWFFMILPWKPPCFRGILQIFQWFSIFPIIFPWLFHGFIFPWLFLHFSRGSPIQVLVLRSSPPALPWSTPHRPPAEKRSLEVVHWGMKFLVNQQKPMENHHGFYGKTHCFDWAMFNSYVTNH